MQTATTSRLAYRLESEKPFDTVVENLERLTPKHQFRVLAVHDVRQTLAEKGFERGPLKIIEVCNAGFAHEALLKTIDVSLFIPCKFAVHTEGGKTVVTLGRPRVIAEMLPQAGLEGLAGDVEEKLKKIVQAAV
jgi:uncharacterized protein (DUF302 family)